MRPDIEIDLALEPYAPHRARHAVAGLAGGAPDLRDVIVLLVSELVTGGVRRAPAAGHDHVELRAWKQPRGVRIELAAPRAELLPPAEGEPDPDDGYSTTIIDQIALRHGVERDHAVPCAWFEIER